jgi:ATP-dependent Zn protease
MQSQYEYARDHIEQSRLSTSSEREQSFNDSGVWPAAWSRGWYLKIFDFLFRYSLIFGLLFYYYKELKKSSNNQFGINTSGEFEFKKSEEIKERLADVKGIDEITEEIL